MVLLSRVERGSLSYKDSMMENIVPVKKSDGAICLYDKINSRYLYNLGTGSLTEL